jgi:glycosyltransferase involved in cell wall biosynthesis
MSKILYISYDGLTDPLGQSQILPYIIELSREGYNFVLLSCEKVKAYKKNKTIIEELLKNTSIEWSPIIYTKNPPVLSALFDYWRLKRKAISLFKVNKFQLVHCRSYIPSMIGLWMQKHYGVKFVFDMRGFWADERVEGGLWNMNNIIYKRIYSFFKKKEKAFLENADHIISLTFAGKKEIESWKHIDKNPLPISIIPCCVDTDLFEPTRIRPEDIEKVRKDLGIRANEPVLTYLGSVGTWYLLDDMLAFFLVFLEKFSNARFLFITQDDPRSILSKARKAGVPVDRVIIVSSERTSVPIYASVGEFSIFFIKPCFSKQSSSPTKQGELMALGIPVICNSGVGDTDMIVKKYDSGQIVDSLDEQNYRQVVNNIEGISFDADKIRKGALNYFSLKLGVSNYKKIYQSLLN